MSWARNKRGGKIVKVKKNYDDKKLKLMVYRKNIMNDILLV